LMSDSNTKGSMTRRDVVAGSLGIGALSFGAVGANASIGRSSGSWDLQADVVVIGTGAVGLPAAIIAKEAGSSVIMVEAEKHAGGHAMVSGGTIPLGGGTSAQKKYGIVDSPDLLFRDLTDWSVVEPNGFPDFRYNDREIVRAFADNAAPTYEWLAAHGVAFMDIVPGFFDGVSCGNSAPRSNYAAGLDWPVAYTGKPLEARFQKVIATGAGVVCPLLAAAEKAGVKILLEHRMTSIVRENPNSGRVLGIVASNNGRTLHIRANKAVIIGTGGSTGNVNFRRMFDPRLTEEYCGIGGMPWSNQDASGELAAMAIGASLWGLYNQTGEFGSVLAKPQFIGCQYGYLPFSMQMLSWMPGSPVFDKARATGLRVADWQDLILVNMEGSRFYDETQGGFTANNFGSVKSYVKGSYLNAKNINTTPTTFSTPRLPASAMDTTAAVQSGRFSTRMRLRARAGFRHRQASTSKQGFFSAPTRWLSSPTPSRCSISESQCAPPRLKPASRDTIHLSSRAWILTSAKRSRSIRSRSLRFMRLGRRQTCTIRARA